MRTLLLGLLVFVPPTHVFAQFTYPTPGDYVDGYGIDIDTNTGIHDTTSWIHRTFTNGFVSMEEVRDTAWAGADLISKRVYFGNPNQLDSSHSYTIDNAIETLIARTVYEYPASNEKVTRNFNSQNNVFEESSRRYEVFDGSGKLIEETAMLVDWQTNLLDYSYRFNYGYTSFGALDTTWLFTYDGSFILDQVIYRTYNGSNKVVDQYYTSFSNGNQIIEQRYEHFYNNAGILDHIHHYFYEPNGTYDLERYYRYDHDANGITTYEIEYDVIGPDTLNDWFIGHEVFWGYDATQLVSSEFRMYFSSGSYHLWNQRYVYSSSIFPSGSSDEPSLETTLTLYPNPTTDVLKVTSSKLFDALTVYDLNGQQVLSVSQQETREGEVPVKQLKSGHYILHVQGSDGSVSKKNFIKH